MIRVKHTNASWWCSRTGMGAALIFLGLAAAMFLWHVYSVKTNPADSGESAIGFALFALPWMAIIPREILKSAVQGHSGYLIGWLCVFVNSLIVYGVVTLLSKGHA